MRCTPVRCTFMRYIPLRCTPVRYTPMRYTPIVARSRQVCIYWLWKHCLLLSFYLRDEQILIDIGNMIVGSSYLFHHIQLVLPPFILARNCRA